MGIITMFVVQLNAGDNDFQVTFQGFMDVIGVRVESNDELHIDICPSEVPGPVEDMRMRTSIEEATVYFDVITLVDKK